MENFANFIITYIEKTKIHGITGWFNQLEAYEWNGARYRNGIQTTKNFHEDSKKILMSQNNDVSWHQHCENIREWGGMLHRITPEMSLHLKKSVIYLQSFSPLTDCDLSTLPIFGKRIATASKVYHFSDPSQWTIYDSRVGFAIHQLIYEYAKEKGVIPSSLFETTPFCLPDSQTKIPQSKEKRRKAIYPIPPCSSEMRSAASFIWASHLHRLIAIKLNERSITKPEYVLSTIPKWELPHVEMVFFVLGDRKWINAPELVIQDKPQSQFRKQEIIPHFNRQQEEKFAPLLSFPDAYQLLRQHGPALVISSRGTKYNVEAWTMRNGDHVIRAKPSSGIIYIHQDCWGKDVTCQGTRAGGIYNGEKNIFRWLLEQKQ